MMIKIAVVLCAVLATNMVCAKDMEDVEEQALDDLLNVALSEEVHSPEDNVALQGLITRAFGAVRRGVGRLIHHAHKGARAVSGACDTFGYSPEEAHAEILEAYPELKDVVSEEHVKEFCGYARRHRGHGHHHHRHGRRRG